MNVNLEDYKNDLLFLTLGGTNEIGVNVNCYHIDGKWIMIDCGSGFDKEIPGVEVIVADLTFVEKHIKTLEALIITHAHEDHIGAIQYLYKRYLKCPIYTTKFTANFLKLRLIEYNLDKEVDIRIVEVNDRINIGPFDVEFFQLAHSAPEMMAIMLRTSKGNIFHTGDWKFDHDPVVGPVANEALLAQYGREGILAMVCDSTNVFNKESSGSEGALQQSLLKICKECTELLVVTTFASNLARLDTLCTVAKACGRMVVLAGRSMHRMYCAAQDSGYLLGGIQLIDEKEIYKFKRSEILVISTGCQGETMAAVAKMSLNNHNIKLVRGDTIIFSSKIIPGNEKNTSAIFNRCVRSGINVITEKDAFVHVSGHPGIEELRKMYSLLKPKIAIPVHGEPVHIYQHGKLAREFGVPFVIEVENGNLVNVNPSAPSIIAKVHTGYYGIDGGVPIETESHVFKARARMRDNGIIISTLIYVDSMLVGHNISCVGCFEYEGNFINYVSDKFKDSLSKGVDNFSVESVKKIAKSIIKKALQNKSRKNPLIIINVETPFDVNNSDIHKFRKNNNHSAVVSSTKIKHTNSKDKLHSSSTQEEK